MKLLVACLASFLASAIISFFATMAITWGAHVFVWGYHTTDKEATPINISLPAYTSDEQKAIVKKQAEAQLTAIVFGK